MPEVLDLCQQPKPETGVVGMRADCVLWGGGASTGKGGGGGEDVCVWGGGFFHKNPILRVLIYYSLLIKTTSLSSLL